MSDDFDVMVDDFLTQTDGAYVLDQVLDFLTTFVAYPNEHAAVAHTLWVAHTYFMDKLDSTPRIAFLSPEPGSGKTRALEVTEPLVHNAVHAINVSAAYLFRKVGEDPLPVILYDEIDTIFGPKAKENEDIRGLLNAGHRQGAISGRVVMRGQIAVLEDFPAFCAVALAGLNDLPDTIMSRSVVINMRRRAPHERVEPWRPRINAGRGHQLRNDLTIWAGNVGHRFEWPDLPEVITDRNADVWEALLAVADLAGGHWPQWGRAAAIAFVTADTGQSPSLRLQLLTDMRIVFAGEDRMTTAALIEKLTGMDEAPWSDLHGKPLDARGLARRLQPYGVRSRDVKVDQDFNKVAKGYYREDLHDAWERYLPVLGDLSATSATAATYAGNGLRQALPVADQALPVADSDGLIHAQVARVAAVADRSPNGRQPLNCTVCAQPMSLVEPGQTTHPTCVPA